MKKINIKTILIPILIILIIVSVIILVLLLKEKRENEAVPVIKLLGEANIKLELNAEYQESGATAKLEEQDITNKIKTIGNVDISKTGRYEIKYYVTNNKNKNRVETKRIIDVVDTVKPEINLKGHEQVTIYTGAEYKEEGAIATDNYDGDISSKIIISGEVDTKKVGTYTIKYYVQDSSANSSEISRTITVKKNPVVNTTVVSSNSGRGLPILMYHFFYDKNVSTGADSNWLEISIFEEQMKYLSENNYYFPSWQEVADFVDGKITLPEKSVVITADDGDPSFFKLAVPIIKKYNVKATSFVVASWYAWDAVKYESENVSIQSHSYNMHRAGENGKGIFLSNTYDEALQDIKTSQKELGGSSVIAFAYPFGQYDDKAKQVLTDAGIKIAVTTKSGRASKGSNKLELPRMRIMDGMSLEAFKDVVR
jgi:peptidoglycan/xylan/chitin deacetylase (PgdA/CDA1 family)